MAVQKDDPHFRTFAKALEFNLNRHEGLKSQTREERQGAQLKELLELEDEFKTTLIEHHWGPNVYRDFVIFITEKNRNILTARPYFRERQKVFTAHISKALKARDYEALYPFKVNYVFIIWVVNSRKWRNGKIPRIARKIELLRHKIVEENLPLAISRARIFYNRTPRSHLTYMDIVQIATEGLLSAIDKFCPESASAFRHVVIGRMIGNFIAKYNETPIHFFPSDKRKIYRANKYMGKSVIGEINYDALVEKVNENTDVNQHTNSIEIASLLSAASCVSAESLFFEDDSEDAHFTLETKFKDDEAKRPDVMVEEAMTLHVMQNCYSKLSVLERKLLYLHGVNI